MLQHYDFNEAQELMYTKEVLTAEEAKLCFDFLPVMAKAYLFYIGNYSQRGDYLNLNVYSEHDHEKRQYEIEIGG